MDSKEITSGLRFIENLHRELPGAPTQQVLILLRIMQEPGINQPDLADTYDLTGASVSRSLRALGQYQENDKHGNSVVKGPDLVELRPDLYRPRSLACFLTKKGKALQQKLLRTANGAGKLTLNNGEE